MFYKLTKYGFKVLINSLQFIQVSLIFLCFFIIMYWMFDLAGAPFVKSFAPFFETIKEFVHLFYTRRVQLGQVVIDFSFLLAALGSLLIAWGIKFVVDFVSEAEIKFESVHKALKKKDEEAFNVGLEKQYLVEENRNNKFIIFVKFIVTNHSAYKEYSEENKDFVKQKQKQILEEFFENLEGVLNCKEEFAHGGLLLYFKDFETIDDVLSQIRSIIKITKQKYSEEKFHVDHLVSVVAYATADEIPVKIEKLRTLLKLGFKNRIACVSSFKYRYLLLKNPKYKFEEKGIYKIYENEEVFCLKSIKQD